MIQIQSLIHQPIHIVWKAYNQPEDIKQWNQASPDWHCPHSEVDLKPGGRFKSTMAAKDGSFQFDFIGTYTEVIPHEKIAYTMDDERKALIFFESQGDDTLVQIYFDPEQTNSEELQRKGWNSILNSFKNYVENID